MNPLTEHQTPRTDAEHAHRAQHHGHVRITFARTLERENAALIEWILAREALDALDEFDHPHNYQAARKRMDAIEAIVRPLIAEMARK